MPQNNFASTKAAILFAYCTMLDTYSILLYKAINQRLISYGKLHAHTINEILILKKYQLFLYGLLDFFL